MKVTICIIDKCEVRGDATLCVVIFIMGFRGGLQPLNFVGKNVTLKKVNDMYRHLFI